jgi:hypothetical protein
MNKGEPPSSSGSTSSLFLVGRNSRGNWVVQDQRGLRGGLFLDCAEALKFAKSESGKNPQAVIIVPGLLELDMSQNSRIAQLSQFSTADVQTALRRVA